MKYTLTLILSDDRGTTRVVFDGVDSETLQKSPMLSALMDLHEHSLPNAEPPAKERRG